MRMLFLGYKIEIEFVKDLESWVQARILGG